MSATSVNPNNWHWTSKDCRLWTRDYLDTELVKIAVDEGDKKAAISRVISCEGDVDVAMRKRKIITIYDLKIQMEFNGEVNGTEASGSITCPEVSYDLGPSDYVFEMDLYEANKEKEPVKQFAREKLLPKVREFFGSLSKVLLETHGNDVYLSTEEHNGNAARGLPSHSSLTGQQKIGKTSTNTPSKSASSLSASSGSDGSHASAVVNTSNISENFSFDAPADELYATFFRSCSCRCLVSCSSSARCSSPRSLFPLSRQRRRPFPYFGRKQAHRTNLASERLAHWSLC
ncbi:chaperone activator Aha1 [Schizosaccharomyces cryophilus OY26]|uniref:Chaperone activator Aha1 n=1 Tax=Schizosaccharomyces cryophilus (strain OY26 / ATCC MYA-4695 / CBS 11777 / NBRC 106824 / NRRL Y48691) TaxID=653667 RepID=S9WXV3_SCHCR|nr:chaperone activator Aha1 [Schizosaccharomyces cryophilus OY26]EPY49547.1 chaperone activator Aha1 [Schizosaccharomyces cryophilus OY26]